MLGSNVSIYLNIVSFKFRIVYFGRCLLIRYVGVHWRHLVLRICWRFFGRSSSRCLGTSQRLPEACENGRWSFCSRRSRWIRCNWCCYSGQRWTVAGNDWWCFVSQFLCSSVVASNDQDDEHNNDNQQYHAASDDGDIPQAGSFREGYFVRKIIIYTCFWTIYFRDWKIRKETILFLKDFGTNKSKTVNKKVNLFLFMTGV